MAASRLPRSARCLAGGPALDGPTLQRHGAAEVPGRGRGCRGPGEQGGPLLGRDVIDAGQLEGLLVVRQDGLAGIEQQGRGGGADVRVAGSAGRAARDQCQAASAGDGAI